MDAKQKTPKRDRDLNLAAAMENMEEVESSIAFYGMTLVIYGLRPGETHEWQFFGDDGKMVLQYWPTTKNSRVRHGGWQSCKTLSGWEEAMELAIDSCFAKTRD